MLTVKVESYDDLSVSEKEEFGAETFVFHNFLRIKENGETIAVHSDCMEPEDTTFTRDLRWIKGAIESAYAKGLEAGISMEKEPAAKDSGKSYWHVAYASLYKHETVPNAERQLHSVVWESDGRHPVQIIEEMNKGSKCVTYTLLSFNFISHGIELEETEYIV